jgi:hypothetical protein
VCPEKGTGFAPLVTQVKFDIFYFMGIDNSTLLCPTIVIDLGGNTVCRRGGGKDVHDEALVVTIYRKIHFPTVFGTPMPVKHVLIVLSIEVPVYFTPKGVDTYG